MHHTGVYLHGWLDLRHISTVWRWLTPMRPPPTTHTQAHVWASSFCSNTPSAPREGSYLSATFGFVCMCMLLPCVGSWLSQKRLSSSSRLMSLREKTTLTTSVWPVRPKGESQTCINEKSSCDIFAYDLCLTVSSLLLLLLIRLLPSKCCKLLDTTTDTKIMMSACLVKLQKIACWKLQDCRDFEYYPCVFCVSVIECMCHG